MDISRGIHTVFFLLSPLAIIIYGFIDNSIVALIMGTTLSIMFFNISIFINKKVRNCFLVHTILAVAPIFISLIKENIFKGLIITGLLYISIIIHIICIKIKINTLETHSLPDLNVISEPLPVYTQDKPPSYLSTE